MVGSLVQCVCRALIGIAIGSSCCAVAYDVGLAFLIRVCLSRSVHLLTKAPVRSTPLGCMWRTEYLTCNK